MKRNKFFMSIIAVAVLPFSGFSFAGFFPSITNKGIKINAGEGRIHGHIKLKGVNSNILDLKVSGKDNNGGMAIFEQTSLTPGRGTPLHKHHFQDETFYVWDGEYYFQVGDEKFKLKSGDCIFLPRQIPHAWTQISEKGKMTVIVQPAGKLEEFFVTMAALKKEPTKSEIAQIFADNEMEIVGPPLKID